MTKIQLLEMLKDYAVEYSAMVEESIHRNNHMNNIVEGDTVKQHISDAILVDFLNYVGMKQAVDYGMYTSDLVKERIAKNEKRD